MEERERALEAHLGASRVDEERLKRERDNIASDSREFEIHYEYVIFLESKLKMLRAIHYGDLDLDEEINEAKQA